jgi:hypothetical protein
MILPRFKEISVVLGVSARGFMSVCFHVVDFRSWINPARPDRLRGALA